MNTFDIVIKGGTVIDGMRNPRLRADLGIKDGRVAKIGRLTEQDADEVVDATGCFVAPGFVDLHTHYDAQIFWDPYCTISGYHGVTSVVIGNCGFGFAPVRPEMRERMMQSMTRVEAIPLDAMKSGMPWDWVTYPEFLASIDATPKGVNVLPYVPLGPLLVWVLGLEDAKSGRAATPAELAQLKSMLHEAMDAGGCGWSAQRMPPYGGLANQRDFDGTPMPTDCMPDETAIAMAEVLAERNEGFMQMTYVTGDVKHDSRHFEELAEVSGRPIIYNAVQTNDKYPERHRKTLQWIDSCRQRGIPVYAQTITTAAGYTITLEDWNMFDDSEAWMEALTGTIEEKKRKIADPARRQALRDDMEMLEAGSITASFRDMVILSAKTNPDLKKYQDRLIGEVADEEGKHPVDVLLDLSLADDLKMVFYVESVSTDLENIKDLLEYPYSIYGLSDGGAHTKFFTAGRYPTETLTRHVRDHGLISLEEAHWHLSALPAHCAGFKDRGTLREGAPADVLVYDLDELAITDMEVVHDFPGGEWRRVQKAVGYRYIFVNGKPTYIDGKETGHLPGVLLRHGGATVA